MFWGVLYDFTNFLGSGGCGCWEHMYTNIYIYMLAPPNPTLGVPYIYIHHIHNMLCPYFVSLEFLSLAPVFKHIQTWQRRNPSFPAKLRGCLSWQNPKKCDWWSNGRRDVEKILGDVTWRITPLSKWLVTPIYKPFRPFGRGPATLLRITFQLTWTQIGEHASGIQQKLANILSVVH